MWLKLIGSGYYGVFCALALLLSGSSVASAPPHAPADDERTCDGYISGDFSRDAQVAHPFSVKLYTEYTDVEVATWIPGRNYDIIVESPDLVYFGIATALIRDLNSNDSFGNPIAGLSDSDHRESSQPYIANASDLRCGGSAVAHPGTNSTGPIRSLRKLRFTVKAPAGTDGEDVWTFRIAVVTMPEPIYNVSLSVLDPVDTWPQEDNRSGEFFSFNSSFNRTPAVSTPVCSTFSVASCYHPQSNSRQCFTDSDLFHCSLENITAIAASEDSFILLGNQNGIFKLNSVTLQSIAVANIGTGQSRLLHIDEAAESVLSCGSSYGRPRCEFLNVTNLVRLDGTRDWIATGVVPRDEQRGGLLVAGNSVFSSRYQVGLPNKDTSDANVISRSELTNLTMWTYMYSEGTSSSNDDNGLFRSVNLRDRNSVTPWLSQPGSENHRTYFTAPWTRDDADPYVYFGLYERTQGGYFSRIARVCKNESSPLVSRNTFNTFLKMEISCNWNSIVSRSSPLTKLTSTATGTGAHSLYISFTSTDGLVSGICAYSYNTAPGGINYEMNGKIDTSITGSFFWQGAERFHCNRSRDDASQVFYVHPLHQEPGYLGQASSNKVVWVGDGHMSNPVVFMEVHTEEFGRSLSPIDILWTVNSAGIVTRILIASNRSEPGNIIQTYNLAATPTAFALDPISSRAFIGSDAFTASIQFDSCMKASSCTECIELEDPYCGWCEDTSLCQRSTSCSSNSTWVTHLDRTSAQCAEPPNLPYVTVLSVQADSIRVFLQATDDESDGEVEIYVNSSSTRVLSFLDLPIIVTLDGLTPFSYYPLSIVVRGRGGIKVSDLSGVTTSQAPPAQMNLDTSSLNSSCVYIQWVLPEPINGVISHFLLSRNGSSVSQIPPHLLAYNDCDLEPFVLYSYVIAAVNGDDDAPLRGPPSEPNIIRTLGAAPSRPTNLTIETTNISAQLLWSTPEFPNGQLREYAIFVNGLQAFRNRSEALLTSYHISNLDPSAQISVAVKAVSDFGASESAEATAETNAAIPSQPTLRLSSRQLQVSTSSYTFEWESLASQGASFYTLYLVMHTNTTVLYNGTSTTATVSNLEPCSWLSFGVSADSLSGSSGIGLLSQIYTNTSRPLSVPHPPWIQERSQGSINISFVASSCDMVSYYIGRRASNTQDEWVEFGPLVASSHINQNHEVPGIFDNESYEIVVSEVYRNSDASTVRSPWSTPLFVAALDIVCTVSTTLSTSISSTQGSLSPTNMPSVPPTLSTTRAGSDSLTSTIPLCTTISSTTAIDTTTTPDTFGPSNTPSIPPSVISTGASTVSPTSTTAYPTTSPIDTPISSIESSTSTISTTIANELNRVTGASSDSCESESALIIVVVIALLLLILAIILWVRLRSLERRVLSQEKFAKSGSYSRPDLVLSSPPPNKANDASNNRLILEPSDISLDMMGYLDVGGLDDEGNAMTTFAGPTSQYRPGSSGRDSLLDTEQESQFKLDGALDNHANNNMLHAVTFGRTTQKNSLGATSMF